jgi:hypothetical protein|tara:strand:- start:553 stop:762 length:210 start_codon:yes stop_codon:yes gene_type:complete
MARTYFCDCGGKVEEGGDMTCKCGHVFGNSSGFSVSTYINMRETMSGTTKMEFRETTMGDSMTDMGIKH